MVFFARTLTVRMTVRTAQTAKTSHREASTAAWGRHRSRISCREAARTGYRSSDGNMPVILNVARMSSGAKTLSTSKSRRNFLSLCRGQVVCYHRSAGGRDVRHGARPPWHGVHRSFRQRPQHEAELTPIITALAVGANGDAIDLTAKLFGLNPRQARQREARK